MGFVHHEDTHSKHNAVLATLQVHLLNLYYFTLLMKHFFSTLLVMAVLASGKYSFAQTLNGSWYGLGTVVANGENSSYMAELKLKQRGRLVSGYFSYYFRDSLFTVKLSGTYDVPTKRLRINPLSVIHYQSTSTRMGVDCMMSGSFTLVSSRAESSLSGSFTSDAAHKFTVPDLNFRFRFSADTATLASVETGLESLDTVASIASTKPDTVLPVRGDFQARRKTFTKELEITASSIRVEVYDNGTIDNDMISLFFNNKEILHKASLTHKAIRLKVNLDTTLAYNELSMYAENLGAIPPNTAAMIIYDGSTRHELILTSDLDQTATIRLKRKEHQ